MNDNKIDLRVFMPQSEFLKATGLSRERLRQLINGYTNRKKGASGTLYEYRIEPVLVEDVDYKYRRAKCYVARKLVKKYKKG